MSYNKIKNFQIVCDEKEEYAWKRLKRADGWWESVLDRVEWALEHPG
jgi:hypothetical protein